MSELLIFSKPEFGQVRSMMIEDVPWFVGRDVAKAMGYAKPENAIAAHVDAEDITTTLIQGSGSPNQGNGSNYKSQMSIINESGLYSLILSSKLPSAKRFKRWVTSEVLPALRRTGRYEVEARAEEEVTPATDAPPPERKLTHDDYLRAASIVATCRNERLPYVLAYLKQGGIEIPDLPEVEEKAQKALPAPAPAKSGCTSASDGDQLEIIRLLNEARDHGYSDCMIARLVGAAKNDIRRWRIGKYHPRAGRVEFIKKVLNELIDNAAAE